MASSMITSQKQYNVTRRKLDELEQGLAAARSKPLQEGEGAQQRAWSTRALETLVQQLRDELVEWEALRRCEGGEHSFEVSSFGRIADLLIGARIAAGLTQRALAERLDMR